MKALVLNLQKRTPSQCSFFTVLLHMHWQFLLGTFAMTMSLICNHRQFLLGISAMDKQNQKNTKTQKTQWQDPTLCHYSPPWGVQPVFCCLFGFLFSGSLLFFFEGLAKQHKSEGPRPNSMPVLPLLGLQICFWLFYCLLWVCGSFLENYVKNMAKCRHHWGNLRDRLRNFVYVIFQNVVKTHCKNIGSQWICRTDFDIDIVESTP